MPETWNGWKFTRVLNWYCARKHGKVRWIFWDEIPLLTGKGGNEMHKVNWLNREFPI